MSFIKLSFLFLIVFVSLEAFSQEVSFNRGRFMIQNQTIKVDQLDKHLTVDQLAMPSYNELISKEKTRSRWGKAVLISGGISALAYGTLLATQSNEFPTDVLSVSTPAFLICAAGFVVTTGNRNKAAFLFAELHNEYSSLSDVQYHFGITNDGLGFVIGF